MQFFIIFYNDNFTSMPGESLVRATAENKSRVFDWVEGIHAGGGTHPTAAMLKALSLEPDAIWLLSDGLFAEKACNEICRANLTERIQIHTIAFYDNNGEKQLKQVAQENRGKYRFVPGIPQRPRRP